MARYGGFQTPPTEVCNRMYVSTSIWMLPLMTSHLCLLILSSLTVSSQLGLEDVFFSPQDQTVKEGEAVFLQCVSGESSPPASITWLKDGTLVTRGRQIQGEYGGGKQRKTSGTLRLFNATLEDDGIYICVTCNPSLNISKESRPAKLTVQRVPRRPTILQGPDNITVAMGTEVSMHCAVGGFPVPMVHWFKDDCLLSNGSASFSLQNNGQLLTFRNVTKEDEGFYHCEVSNQIETIRSRPAFLLPAAMGWSFIQQPTNLTAKRGQNVTVTCRPPYSRPAAQVAWFRNNQLLRPTPRVTVLPSGDLILHSVQEDDSGSYFCRASNIPLHRFVTSRKASLTVQAPPTVKMWPPALTVPLGARVELRCEVSGQPLPSISWVKRGQSKQTGGKITLGFRNATLYIRSARSYDEGVYVCAASNTLGQSHGTATLTVAVSPIIVTSGGQVSCRIGAPVVIPCRAVGILPITYTWTRGRADSRSLINNTQDRHIDEDGALRISSMQWSDAGEYFCTAENRAGQQQRRTVLSVSADDRPFDRREQTRPVSSESTSTSEERPSSSPSGSVLEQKVEKTPHSQVAAHREDTTCSSSLCDTTTNTVSRRAADELNTPAGPPEPPLKHRLAGTTPPLVTHMHPPMLPPPPHPNFRSGVVLTHLPEAVEVLSFANRGRRVTPSHIQYQVTESHLRAAEFQHRISDKLLSTSVSPAEAFTEMSRSQSLSELSLSGLDSYSPTSVTPSFASQVESTQIPRTERHLPLTLNPRQSYTQSPTPYSPLELTHPPVSSESLHPSATQPEPPSSKTTRSTSTTQSQPPPPQRETDLDKIQPSVSPKPTSAPLEPESDISVMNHVDMSTQLNTSQQQGHPVQLDNSTDDTELTEWLKKNTSQSPMTSNDPRVTQRSPSWLPILEKHDIPIVVGVGVSLAFIFITVTFYSMVQKNEPAPTSRAAQRNVGVPIRHAERRVAGRTYENRAFEDDECMAVIEQSPNTADTHARPPGLSLVTVQMEPTSENVEGDAQPALNNHSVSVETYPEPILDTKVDSFLEEEAGGSLPQPTIQLQCSESCPSHGGDNHSPCQDALPPASPLPSRSPSPSLPYRQEEGLHSSLTLQSSEPFSAPIHHSLSISHGTSPLLLSHQVSLGLSTVAVDIHYYPSAPAAMTAGTSTHVNSVSNSISTILNPPFASSQGNEEGAARLHQCK